MLKPTDVKTDVLLTFDFDDELSTRIAAKDETSGVKDPEMGAFGPKEGYKEVLRILKDYEFLSTFFVIGKSAVRYPDAISEIAEMGHDIGNHSYSHRSYRGLSRDAVFEEVSKAHEALKNFVGVAPQCHRSPYWHENEYLHLVLEELDYKWNGDAHCDDLRKTFQIEWKIKNKLLEIPSSTYQGDWANFLVRRKTADEVLDLWLNRLSLAQSSGAVFTLVCHPFIIGRKECIGALQGFASYLNTHRQNFRVVTGLELFNELVQKATAE